MARKSRRFPIASLILTIILLAWSIRSIWRRDALAWTTFTDQTQTAIIDTYCIEIERLGIGFLYDQQMIPSRALASRQRVDAIPIGLRFLTEDASTTPQRWFQKLGFNYETQVDEKPETFTNTFRFSVPTWLLALLLSIDPLRFALRRNRDRITAKPSPVPEPS